MSASPSPKPEEVRASHVLVKVFKGHTNLISSVAYLEDGKLIISGSADGTIRIWNVANGNQEGESMAHFLRVQSIATSPDEKRLVSGGGGMTLWALESRTVVWKTETVYCWRAAFSPDGQLIAASNGKDIVLLEAESGKPIKEPLQFGEEVWCLAFSRDGTRLAAGSVGGKVQVFDAVTGETTVGPFTAHKIAVGSVMFTLDEQQFITASWDKSIRVWDSADGREVGEPMLHEDYIRQIALSPDGRQIASASEDQTVRVWDLSERRQIGEPLQGQGKPSFTSVAWSPNGRSVVAGDDRGDIHMWSISSLKDSVDVTAPALVTSNSARTPRSRTDSLSSSILNLPAGSSPTPPQSPQLNTDPAEDIWEYSSNESFDSVLDLPADGTRPAQRRRRRRRRAAPVASTSSPPIQASVPPRHSPPLDQASSPPAQTTPAAHVEADAPASRVGALGRLWKRRRTLPRWTRRRPRKNRDEPHGNRPVQPDPAPPRPASPHSELAADHADATPKPRTISRFLTRSRRQPPNDTLGPENIEMRPPPGQQRRNRNASARTRPRRQPQSEVVNVAAGRLDQRLAASSNKWTDKIDWLDYICFCMCCPWNKVISESDSERPQGNGPGSGSSSGSSSSSHSSLRRFNPNDCY
ncbi:quinon protein alcohol dehydrogenase-like superfamily [Hygrophoropsis aurantiaca]|uniref:Quinon protein alcohol dehydrogenase-like superfamily n=1 Tax=Hygrophoropsis aurantiaca TaxID=72124 RepID=A0ACB8A677_9AGAM|nr:quinon protein alcohol dehydrogenase-like superfamily [Hygrophoropsis aurantiaca]